ETQAVHVVLLELTVLTVIARTESGSHGPTVQIFDTRARPHVCGASSLRQSVYKMANRVQSGLHSTSRCTTWFSVGCEGTSTRRSEMSDDAPAAASRPMASRPAATGGTEEWTDRKRYLWLIGLVVPSLVFLAIGLREATGWGVWLWI